MNFDREKMEQKILFMQTNVIKLKKLSKIDKGIFIEDFRKQEKGQLIYKLLTIPFLFII